MITVFTPAYNRAHTLARLYDSLKEQTVKNFEWLVVDDGSTDDTPALFETYGLEKEFPVRYYRQENHGKQAAINFGVSLAQGDLFFIVDSDDYLCENAVEKIIEWAATLPSGEKFCGVAGLKGYAKDEVVGQGVKGGAAFVDASAIERKRYGLYGDKAEVFYTEVLKEFPFVIYENEKFITEDTVWLSIALSGYKMRWFNEIIYICEYLEDGLTKNGDLKFIRNPQGTLYTYHIYKKAFPQEYKIHASKAYAYYLAAKAQGKTKKETADALQLSSFRFNLYVTLVKINRRIKKLWRK